MSDLIVSRVSFRFAPGGGYAACLAIDESGATFVECWQLAATGPLRQWRTPLPCDIGLSSVLALDTGEVLVLQWEAGRPRLLTLPSARPVLHPEPDRLRLLGAVPATGHALAAVAAVDGGVRLCRIGAAASDVERLASTGALPGRVVTVGDRLVFAGRSAAGVTVQVLNPETGRSSSVPLPAGVKVAAPLSAAGDTVLFGVDTGEQHQLGLLRLGGTGAEVDVDGFEVIQGPRLDGTALPLAMSPDGTEVAIRCQRQLCYQVFRYALATGELRRLDLPDGVTFPAAGWSERGIWLPHSTSTMPTTLWWRSAAAGGGRMAPARPATSRWLPARSERFPTPAGAIEAVVYGPDWRDCDRVVVALHGGPSAHWSLGFEHPLQRLAATGMAVVAPNQRGSTGYGRDHEYAISGAWGGPDLEDLLAIGAHLRSVRGAGRPLPGLYGVSYGAYLGLLALACGGGLWGPVVAVAPFLSGARLYPEAGPRVRALLDRLDGTAPVTDATGPRDLVRLAPRLRGTVMIVHGSDDRTIPVAQSRELCGALRGRPGLELIYRELPGRDHAAAGLDGAVLEQALRLLSGAPVPVPARSGGTPVNQGGR